MNKAVASEKKSVVSSTSVMRQNSPAVIPPKKKGTASKGTPATNE